MKQPREVSQREYDKQEEWVERQGAATLRDKKELKVKVPAKIIYQMDLQIQAVQRAIARKQKRLDQLKAARARMEKDK